MKRTTCLALAIILTTAICPVFAQAATGERSALQVDLGLGFTSGIDSKKALEIDNVEESAGATLRFGLTYQLPLMENFFLNPTFQMATYTEEIDFGGAQVQIDNQVVNLNSIKTKTTQINFGVKPTYYFKPASAKFRPFGGLGLKLNINSFGDLEFSTRQGDGTGEAPEGKTGLAIGPMVGFDYQVSENMGIPFLLQYDLLTAEHMTSVFLVSTGLIFYF